MIPLSGAYCSIIFWLFFFRVEAIAYWGFAEQKLFGLKRFRPNPIERRFRGPDRRRTEFNREWKQRNVHFHLSTAFGYFDQKVRHYFQNHTHKKNFTFKLFWLKLLLPLMLGWKSHECSSITKFKQTLKIYPKRIVSALRSFFHPPRLTVHRVCISVITVVSTVTKTMGWILPDKNTVKKCNSLSLCWFFLSTIYYIQDIFQSLALLASTI